jgi:hypothetical protein
MITNQLSEPNKLIGTALWEGLTLLVDSATDYVDNQIISAEYDDTKPQVIKLLCYDESRETLPTHHYHYEIECPIDIARDVANHVMKLSVTRLIAGGSIVEKLIYHLRVHRFRKLYPFLISPDRDKYLSILEPDDFEEWFLD